MPGRVEIIVGRIETLAVDAVVNAANRALLPGGGVDGALRRAAGPELTALTARMAPIAEGEAVITPGFNAPAKHIIHVAAPVWFEDGDAQQKIARLGACYVNAIKLAAARELRSLAFPCLGTGNFGWPADVACRTALTHVDAALADAARVERVVYCCFTQRDADLYEAALRAALR